MLPVRSFLLSIFLLCFPLYAFAQNGKISGTVTDNKKVPLPYATITLLHTDSSVVNGAISEEKGTFEIANISTGNYMLRITAVGISTHYINNISLTDDAPNKDLGNITLNFSSKVLDEVQINGEKSIMEMYVDKKVFNVGKNITTAGGSASDVLSNVPSVSVDVDGAVSLRGKGNVTILIDGKPATLLGGDVATALQSLPASSIDNVEVITNPGAKYDAQGITGIINIITVRDKKFGFNGSVNAGAGTRDKYNGGINLNAKNEKWNVFFNSNYRNNKNGNNSNNERYTKDAYLDSSSLAYIGAEDSRRSFGGWFSSLGAEYIINKNNSLTLTQNMNIMRWGNKATTEFWSLSDTRSDGAMDTLTKRHRESVGNGGPRSYSTNLDYKHKFKKEKQELTTNFNFSTSQTKHDQTYYTLSGLYEVPYVDTTWELGPSKGINSSINAQADFTTPFLGKNAKLDAGWRTQMFWFRSKNAPLVWDNLLQDTIRNSDTFFNGTLYNNFDYLQTNHAAYTSFSNQHGNFSYMAGLRLEYTLYDGQVQRLDTNSAFTYFRNEFLNLFPSAFVSYKLPHDQSVYLNFSRRINRPSFWSMMPFLDLTNPQDTSMGNPYLRPEFIYNTEFNYNRQFKKGHNIIGSLYYQYTTNMIERYRKFYADGTSFSQPQNLATAFTYGAELIGRLQLLPIWDATVNMNIFKNEVRGGNIAPELNNSGTSWFAKANTNVKLPAGFSLQLNGNYEAPKVLAQGTLSEVYWVDIALRKNLLKNKATLVLNVSDIFNTRKYTTLYDYDSYYQTTFRNRETRIGNISFTYRFGKDNSSAQPANNGGNKRKVKEKKEEKPSEKERNNLKSDESENGSSGGNK